MASMSSSNSKFSMSTFSNFPAPTSTAEALPTDLTALPSSILLANLIPAVLVAAYVLFTIYKLRYFFQARFIAKIWSSLWRITHTRHGLRAEDGYMAFPERSDEDDNEDGDANFVIGGESDSDDANGGNILDAASATTPLTARSAMSQECSKRKKGKLKVQIQEGGQRLPTPRSGSSWRLSATLHPGEQRGLYTPLNQVTERDDDDDEDDTSGDNTHDDILRSPGYGMSKFFDRRTSRLKKEILEDPEMKVEGLNEDVQRPRLSISSVNEWVDWLVDMIVRRAIRWTVGDMAIGLRDDGEESI